ncbi:MAG: NHL repeat-containing protein [Candidatus Zixiibacteriota bacterium]|jgi:DNA-binding beta-propeller fold protein YncE
MDLKCGTYVRCFSRGGVLLSEIGTPPGSDFALRADGVIYVFTAFGKTREVRYYNSGGSFIGKWDLGPPGEGKIATFNFGAIATAPSGGVYVAEWGYDRLSHFTASGSLLGRWGKSGSGPGEFYGPNDIAVAPSGTVYVSDSGNGRIQYFTPDGKYLGEWGSGYAPDGGFGGLLSIAVTPEGDVLTADIYKKEIEVFSGEGSLIGSFTIPGLKDREYYFRDLAVGPDGTVYVSFSDPGYIWAFAPNKEG